MKLIYFYEDYNFAFATRGTIIVFLHTKPLLRNLLLGANFLLLAWLWNYQIFILVHGQSQNPLVQPKFTCPTMTFSYFSKKTYLVGIFKSALQKRFQSMPTTYKPADDKIYNKTCVTSKDSDQPVHPVYDKGSRLSLFE